MPEQIQVPIRLSRETWNQLIEDWVEANAPGILEEADEIVDTFPGGVDLKGRQKLSQYMTFTTDLGDFARIADPDYEQRVRAGMDTPPGSPFWVNALRVPGEFKTMAKEFVSLMQRYAGGAE